MIYKTKELAKKVWWTLARTPHVTTTRGLHRTDQLEKREGSHEDHRARAEWVEYWKEGELVHRSVNIALKGVEHNISQEALGG